MSEVPPAAATGPPPSYYPTKYPEGGDTYQPGQQPPPPTATLIVGAQPQVLGPRPARITCPHCNAEISTRLVQSRSMAQHISAAIIFAVTVWCCLCCFAAIPYCMDDCMDAEHECPNCNKTIGHYKRI